MPTGLVCSPQRVVAVLPLSLASILAAACGSTSPAPTEVTSGDVHGTLVNTYVDPSGGRTTVVAPGAAAVPPTIEVAALSPAGGGYHRYAGTVSASGDFTIAGVEPGTYLLELKNRPTGVRYIELSARQVDLGLETFGSTAATASAGTAFDLTVDGLDPLAVNPSIFAFVAGSTIPAGVSPPAAATSTTLAIGLGGAPLPPPSAQGWAYQMGGAPTPGGVPGTYRTTQRASTFSANAIDGVATPVGVTLTAPATTGTLTASWRTGDYEAFGPQVATNATGTGHNITVRALPYGLAGAPGLPMVAATLSTFNAPPASGTLATGGMQWGRFLPAGWQEYVVTTYSCSAPFMAAGATVAGQLGVGISTTDLVSAATTLSPRTSPPRRPTLAGLDATAAQSGVGTTPRLAWDAPDMGDTGNYSVTLFALGNASGSTTFGQIATFRLRSRHLDVPSGLLQAGVQYAGVITAYSTPAFDWSRPLHQWVPNAVASVVVAQFSP